MEGRVRGFEDERDDCVVSQALETESGEPGNASSL